MKITNQKLQSLIQGLSSLAQLRTGAKLSYNVSFTLTHAAREWDIVEKIRAPLQARLEAEPEAVEKEWNELMAQEVEFPSRAVKMVDLEACLDADKITASLLMQLEDFIDDGHNSKE